MIVKSNLRIILSTIAVLIIFVSLPFPRFAVADLEYATKSERQLALLEFYGLSQDLIRTRGLIRILKHFGRIDDGYEDGCTLLHFAVMINSMELVGFMLENKANPLLANDAGLCPLHLAVSDGRIEILEYLLERTPNAHTILAQAPLPRWGHAPSSQEQVGASLLHWAILLEQNDAAEYLVILDADLYARNNQGTMPLALAVRHRMPRVVRAIVENELRRLVNPTPYFVPGLIEKARSVLLELSWPSSHAKFLESVSPTIVPLPEQPSESALTNLRREIFQIDSVETRRIGIGGNPASSHTLLRHYLSIDPNIEIVQMLLALGAPFDLSGVFVAAMQHENPRMSQLFIYALLERLLLGNQGPVERVPSTGFDALLNNAVLYFALDDDHGSTEEYPNSDLDDADSFINSNSAAAAAAAAVSNVTVVATNRIRRQLEDAETPSFKRPFVGASSDQ